MKSQKIEDIKKALSEAMDLDGENDAAVENILRTLDSKKILRYHKEQDVNLLSTAGRVLVAIIDDPTMTIRAISVYLDLSETMIDKTVKQLVAHGLITKTKVNRQNVYRCNKKLILEQPDIQQFLRAITALNAGEDTHVPDEQQDADQFPF